LGPFFSPPFFGWKIDPVLDGFLDRFQPENEPKVDQKSIRSCFFPCSFCNAFFRCFSEISAQFSRSPNLNNRAPVYTDTRFSQNRRFRFRTSLWMDFSSFWPHFRPPNAPKWALGPSREKVDFWYLFCRIFGRFLGPFGSLGEAIFAKKVCHTLRETTLGPSGERFFF
jgi:hypothetical protein